MKTVILAAVLFVCVACGDTTAPATARAAASPSPSPSPKEPTVASVMTKPSGTFDVPLPSDAVPAPDSTVDSPAWISHLFSISEYANFYKKFMQGRGWVIDREDSKTSLSDTYFYYYSFCKTGLQPAVDVSMIVGAPGLPPFPGDIGTRKEAEIGVHSVPDDYPCVAGGGNTVATPTPNPSASPQTTVAFVNAPITAARGQNATLQVRTAANTSCSIEVDYKSGPSTAAGLMTKNSDSVGRVNWTWKVGSNTTPGSWPITVTCGNATAQTQINVT